MNTTASIPGILLSLFLVVSTLGTGCVVSVGGSGGHSRDEAPKPPPIAVPPTNDPATLAEIDAATKLSFDAGKTQALRNVAARPGLDAAAQVHLVNTTLRALSFDAGRADVLLALIGNPAFAPAAKESILRQIDRLDFDASRTQVLNAIQARAAQPAP